MCYDTLRMSLWKEMLLVLLIFILILLGLWTVEIGSLRAEEFSWLHLLYNSPVISW